MDKYLSGRNYVLAFVKAATYWVAVCVKHGKSPCFNQLDQSWQRLHP